MRGWIFGLLVALPQMAFAQGLVPDQRVILSPDTDLPGRDLARLLDSTLDSCRTACTTNDQCTAFTFNGTNGRCFVKSQAGAASTYAGATSGRVARPSVTQAEAQVRRDATPFLTDRDLAAALDQATRIGGPDDLAEAADVAASDTTAAWLAYSAASEEDRAFSAAVNAWLRAKTAAEQGDALQRIATLAEPAGRGMDAVLALELAQQVVPSDALSARLEEARGKYGFRIESTDVQAESATPRICATFTADLAQGTDFAPFLRGAEGLTVEADGPRQLCVEGVRHGERYALTFRQGLPAANGQGLAQSVDLALFVRDRQPAVRFPGRGYVLPRGETAAVPVQTVNASALDLALVRVTDRNILRAMQDSYFAAPVDQWREETLESDLGTEVWQGSATVGMETNRDVTTRLPMDQAIWGLPSGLYALKAAIPGADPYEAPAAWQWFVISDLGLTSFWGNEGLDVVVRGLGEAEAKEGIAVDLVSRANEVLASARTDADGLARFPAGLTRGTGGSAPALVVVREGDADMAFLSLTDAEFDLSDRGVEGREPAPPVDVFLTTDRGAYRAGEVVHLTALARDAQATAIPDLPLTAILRRPDGVEFSRSLAEDIGAGGHVLDLPIPASAPRGVWRVEMRADLDAAPLASETFLVEDFLPERIDFDLTLPEVLRPNATTDMTVDARYLFGAAGADLAVEGEVQLRAAASVQGFEGFRFGLQDEPFDAVMESLPPLRTDAEGRAQVPVTLPFVDRATRPLEARITARVAEGSGRPVEREVIRPVAIDTPMIGLRPQFDGVAAENSEAGFDLVALGADGQPAPAEASWVLNRIDTQYQWYQQYGDWNWEPFTTRERIASGDLRIEGRGALSVPVGWGEYELVVEGAGAASSVRFYAGWYAPADASETPDMLELALDRADYAVGDTAQLRLVPRYDGTALVSVLTDRVVSVRAVPVTAGENLIPLEVTGDWGTGAYVAASVIRPMDVQAGRNPARALGLAHAAVAPGDKRLAVAVETAPETDPRGPLDVAVKVDAPAGKVAHVTLAAVDQGILNLTGFKTPDATGHYFGQRRLGVGIRDIYGRLIDGLNGAEGQVRSGGDAGAQARLQADPPTEELVAFFSGPLTVGADGYARTSFDLPAFNGSVKIMALAWTDTAVGQAEAEVLVRDPVVVTASLPRFLAPGDESRMLLELTHAAGPAGRMALSFAADGVEVGPAPAPFDLTEGGTARFEVPITAPAAGNATITVALTTPNGKRLEKPLAVPVRNNDPEVVRTERLTLAAGESFTFDDNAYAGLTDAHAVMAVGPIARLNAPGLLAALDRYPYGCTEQITSKALPLIYFDQVAQAMRMDGADDIRSRISDAVTAVLVNQNAEGGFGLWGVGSGDFWLDAYVTDFLSRAKAQGIAVPDQAFARALDNLRNQVNYAPDFDRVTNDGGRALAYALMVLAREGAANMGDLRYYAEVKGDDFGSALAQAQLGAALASYGEQVLADAMFARATEIPPDDAQVWRSDYGTALRDAAGVLALAVEAGSTAVDREALATRVANATGERSTQEAAWSLLATHALVDAPGLEGITLDGSAVDGPLVRMAAPGDAPMVLTNGSPRATELTLTAFGVPEDGVQAGGNGYAITRAYYTMDGQEVSPDTVAVGTRLVTVLEVTPFASGEARLMVDDPLPAGFEIDNPNLLAAGDVSGLDWLDAVSDVAASEFRQDRFLTAIDRHDAAPFQLAYVVRAISAGGFHHPAASVRDMYRPEYRAQTDAGRVTVTP